MANEYAVNKADLTAVADMIREKAKATGQLEFPEGFLSALNNISKTPEYATGTFLTNSSMSSTVAASISGLTFAPSQIIIVAGISENSDTAFTPAQNQLFFPGTIVAIAKGSWFNFCAGWYRDNDHYYHMSGIYPPTEPITITDTGFSIGFTQYGNNACMASKSYYRYWAFK